MKLALLLAAVVACASAADIPVTWVIPQDQMPYDTLLINLGDSVTFNWQGVHGVYQLATGPNVGCPDDFPPGPDELAATAPGGSYTWTPTEAGQYNVACQVGNHCIEGMLVSIIVGSGPALAPGAEAPTAPSTAPLTSSEEGSVDGDGA